MGIIINKKIDYDLYPDLLEQLGIDKPLEDKKLYIRYGGPVESGRGLFYILTKLFKRTSQ